MTVTLTKKVEQRLANLSSKEREEFVNEVLSLVLKLKTEGNKATDYGSLDNAFALAEKLGSEPDDKIFDEFDSLLAVINARA